MKCISFFIFALFLNCNIAIATERFVVIGNGDEISDNITGLVWQRCAAGMSYVANACSGVPTTYSHQSALIYATSQPRVLGTIWRLPNVKELSSIVDRSRRNPAIDGSAFPLTPFTGFSGSSLQGFWSSTPVADLTSRAWGVSFSDGFVGQYLFSNSSTVATYVRLVRDKP